MSAPQPLPRTTYRSVFAGGETKVVFGTVLLYGLGFSFEILGLSVLVYARTSSPFYAALAFGIGFLPQLLGGMFLTSLADRFSARGVIAAGLVVRAAPGLAIGLVPTMPVGAMLVLVGVAALVAPVFTAAVGGLLPELLDGDRYIVGRSVMTMISSGTQIAGLGLGGVILALVASPDLLLAAGAALLVSAVVARFGLRARAPRAGGGGGARADGSVVRTTLRGNRALLARPDVRGLLFAQWLPAMCVTGAEALIVPYVGSLGRPEESASALLVALPVGMLAGDLVVGRLCRPATRRRLAFPLAVLLGMPLVVFALSPAVPVAAGLLLLTGAGLAYTLGIQQAFLDSLPEPLRGRGFGLLSTGLMGGQGVTPPLAGALAAYAGVGVTMAAGGALALVVALALHRTLRGTGLGSALSSERSRGSGGAAVPTYVYEFSEGSKDQKELLGGKGANLAEMTNMGLPVPPGFTITTQACTAYLETGDFPEGLAEEIESHLANLQDAIGRRLGDADDPLLVSVRSGAKISMPGMMDTILNVGLNDDTVAGLARRAGDERFAYDSYRRLVQMFGVTVLGLDAEQFEDAIEQLKSERGHESDVDLSADDVKQLVQTFRDLVRAKTGEDFPQDPHEQLRLAIRAVFESWNAPRAILYRRQERIPADLGTAVNIVSMVFGNLGTDSGTGVAFTRDPSSGTQGVYGDYLPNAQGEDVVAGIRNTVALADLEQYNAAAYTELLDIMARLENHFLDLCDIEFTIERGKLWMLQTRVGKRTAAAAFRVAAQLADEGIIDLDEALRRVTGEQLSQLMFPTFDADADRELIATGVNASPGAATGVAVFDSSKAVEQANGGDQVILVRRETNPDDLQGMIAATGVLTSRGGKTSHAAVVARGMGRTCVCGVEDLTIDLAARSFSTSAGTTVSEGEVISIDGSTGEVFLGEVPVVESAVVKYFNGEIPATGDTGDTHTDEVVRAVDRLMRHADERRRMEVRANTDTARDAARARTYGAQGVGLCRTEHMFLGDRRPLIEALIVADSEQEQDRQLAALEEGQRKDFIELLEAMDGLPTTIRLLDPPLHEFLPDLTDLSMRVAVEDARHESAEEDRALLRAVQRLHETNPMMGLRGVRLGIVIPGLFVMQARAILQAAVARQKAGGNPIVEIMIPLVAAVQELETMRAKILDAAEEIQASSGVDLDFAVGTMIELPRAALTAERIAESAEFFSFGTNDLTQMTWGFSRDDVEASFFSQYLELGIFGVSPFESIDVEGVGELVRTGVERGRETRPDLHTGICGEHGGDPASVRFFDSVGLDYVSCSAFRVPVARLEAGRAVVL